MDIVEQSEILTARLEDAATHFCTDNLRNFTPAEYLIVLTAMQVGATTAMQLELENMRGS